MLLVSKIVICAVIGAIICAGIAIPVVIHFKQAKTSSNVTSTLSPGSSTSRITTTTRPSMTNTTTTAIVGRCNVASCRVAIANKITLNITYSTTNMVECNGCTAASYPNFPSDWSSKFYALNFVVYSNYGHDCNGNPYTGNLITCQYYCLRDITCVGFSRALAALDTDPTAACYLKNNITVDQTAYDPTWHTIAFNSA